MKKRILFTFGILLTVTMANPILGQNIETKVPVENLLFDNTTNRLKHAILYASDKQALYAYNIANASTTGFKPILTQEDAAQLAQILPDDDQDNDRGVMMEFLMSRMANNRIQHAAYINLQKKKFEIIRQIATLGKR